MTLDISSWLPFQRVDSHRAGSSAADTEVRIWAQAIHSGAAPRRECTGVQETGWDKGRVKGGTCDFRRSLATVWCQQELWKRKGYLVQSQMNELSYSPVAPVCHCLKETLGELRTVHWYEAALGSQEKSLKVWAENLRSRAWKKCQGLWAGCCSFLELS